MNQPFHFKLIILLYRTVIIYAEKFKNLSYVLENLSAVPSTAPEPTVVVDSSTASAAAAASEQAPPLLSENSESDFFYFTHL